MVVLPNHRTFREFAGRLEKLELSNTKVADQESHTISCSVLQAQSIARCEGIVAFRTNI